MAMARANHKPARLERRSGMTHCEGLVADWSLQWAWANKLKLSRWQPKKLICNHFVPHRQHVWPNQNWLGKPEAAPMSSKADAIPTGVGRSAVFPCQAPKPLMDSAHKQNKTRLQITFCHQRLRN
jgi:hypothetical protein